METAISSPEADKVAKAGAGVGNAGQAGQVLVEFECSALAGKVAWPIKPQN